MLFECWTRGDELLWFDPVSEMPLCRNVWTAQPYSDPKFRRRDCVTQDPPPPTFIVRVVVVVMSWIRYLLLVADHSNQLIS